MFNVQTLPIASQLEPDHYYYYCIPLRWVYTKPNQNCWREIQCR